MTVGQVFNLRADFESAECAGYKPRLRASRVQDAILPHKN